MLGLQAASDELTESRAGYCWRGPTCADPHTPTQTSHEPANPLSAADKGKQRAREPEPVDDDEPMCTICYDTPDGRDWGLLGAFRHLLWM